MNRTAYMTTALVALLLMAMVPAYAQKLSVTVNIPFAFTVDDVRMPAGEYLITSPSEKVITIQRVGGPEVETTMIVNNDGHKGNHSPRLIFRKYDDEVFLGPSCRDRTTPTSSWPRQQKSRWRAAPSSRPTSWR